jgi:hypothetical protein
MTLDAGIKTVFGPYPYPIMLNQNPVHINMIAASGEDVRVWPYMVQRNQTSFNVLSTINRTWNFNIGVFALGY